ncbi:hypothetical protein [Sphingomonas sp. Y38-1Y]|uniref:hypothetical protein n=1 Tax=Sphingomonas sp. Y38-1Y TaxID=3078265 RepID=UPI0028EDB1E5|nr:hypothetical protein [Sphingomonas sp. Y38-1Y]
MTHELELTEANLDAAAAAIGDGPVVMVNLLRFRDTTDYPAGFEATYADARQGYYEGYVGGFRAACAEVEVVPELIYAGPRAAGVLSGTDDDWDEIVLVRYPAFADFRRIIDTDTYVRLAKPHRFAVLADWRFIATVPR